MYDVPSMMIWWTNPCADTAGASVVRRREESNVMAEENFIVVVTSCGCVQKIE